MENDPGSGEAASEPLRDAIEQKLAAHFAQGRLELEDYERRVERAEKAATAGDLRALVADLEPPEELARLEQAQRGALVPMTAEAGVPAPAAEPPLQAYTSTALVPASEVPQQLSMWAVFSGPRKRGPWVAPRRLDVVALFGGADVDLREARLGPGETEINCKALFGGVKVIVPPGLRVVVDGVGVMGAFDDRVPGSSPHPRTDACQIRVSGLVLFGGVEVEERLPGESRRRARRRQRQERKQLLQQGERRLLPPGEGD
jgi:hypothetical protein